MKKVYFINPPRINPSVSSYELPLNISALLAAVGKFAPEVSCGVIDMQLYPDVSIEDAVDEKNGIFCCSVMTYNKELVYSICGKLRREYPDSTIVLGGPHISILKEKVFSECPVVDYLSVGEGDLALPRLLSGLNDPSFDPLTVPGIYTKGSRGALPNDRIADLSCLPSITEGMKYYDMQRVLKRNTYVSYIASRGCPYDCIYCASSKIWGHRITFVNADTVCSDLEWMAQQGVRYINFRDDIFTVNRTWLAKVLPKLKELGIIWGCETRVDCVDRRLLDEMKASGCELIRYGVETFNDKTLKRLNKKLTSSQIKQTLRDTVDAAITEIRVSMMLGLPGENREDVENTFRECMRFSDCVFFKFFSLYPTIGTELYEKQAEYGVEFVGSGALTGHSQINTTCMSNLEINECIAAAYELFHDPDEDFHRDFSIILEKRKI